MHTSHKHAQKARLGDVAQMGGAADELESALRVPDLEEHDEESGAQAVADHVDKEVVGPQCEEIGMDPVGPGLRQVQLVQLGGVDRGRTQTN